MIRIMLLFTLLAFPESLIARHAAVSAPDRVREPVAGNPAIDMPGFLKVSAEAARLREGRRVSEREFIRMSHQPGTLVLDARSRAKYEELHIRGAVNLSFPDITIESLARVIPDRDTRILIYCNNNFLEAEGPFPSKLPNASLNLSTFIALYTYGYRNVYELGPLIDVDETKLEFETSRDSADR